MTVTPIMGPPPPGPVTHSSPEERSRRLALLRDAMVREGYAALVVAGRDDARWRGRTFWVTDVWQQLGETHAVVLPDRDPVFIGGQIFGLGQAMLANWPSEFLMSNEPGTEVGAVLKANGLGQARIGLVGLSDSSWAPCWLNQLQAEAPGVTLGDATELFEEARHANSEEELTYLRGASELWRLIYAELEPKIRPGITEAQLAGEAHRASREFGLRDPMVIIQTSASYLGALTFGTSRRIEKDDVVTVWIESAAPSGYWLEYRRCYSFSPPPTEYRRVWDVTVAAVKAGLSVMKPGVMAHEFTAEVQRVYTEMAGWTCGFHDPKDIKDTYTLHGIGTDAIQGVWVQGKPRVLLENEVVNIHPWIRWADPSDATKYSWLGITDNVLITPKGGILMTHPPDVSDGFIQL